MPLFLCFLGENIKKIRFIEVSIKRINILNCGYKEYNR